MLIIETPIFTRLVTGLLPDADYRILQYQLVANPEAGDIIRGSGGLRKIRWALPGRGKRSGVRVIYYWVKQTGIILMLYLYKKGRQEDLTPAQMKVLRSIVEEEFP